MSGNYPRNGTYFHSDDDGYYDGVEQTRKPWFSKKKDLFRNADNAKSQINRSAQPVALDFDFFCYQLPDTENLNIQPFTIEEEINSSASEISIVQSSIDNFEDSIFAFEYEKESLMTFTNVSAEFEPDEVEVEIRNEALNSISKIDNIIGLIESDDYTRNKSKFLESFSVAASPPVLEKNSLSGFSAVDKGILESILTFEDHSVPIKSDFSVHVFYAPLSSNQSVFLRHELEKLTKDFVDIDKIIDKHTTYFDRIARLEMILNKPGNLRNLGIKYFFHKKRSKFNNKIILANHPNQLPCYYRKSEVVLLPINPIWNSKYFENVYFSLLAIKGKPKIILDYKNFSEVIKKYTRDKKNSVGY